MNKQLLNSIAIAKSCKEYKTTETAYLYWAVVTKQFDTMTNYSADINVKWLLTDFYWPTSK